MFPAGCRGGRAGQALPEAALQRRRRGVASPSAPARSSACSARTAPGKTTTIGVLTTRVRPTAGRVRVAGVDVAADPVQARSRLSVVPQRSNLDRALTARQNLVFHAAYHGVAQRRAQPAGRRAARRSSGWPTGAPTRSTRTPAAWRSGCSSPARSCTAPACCSSTSRAPASTRRPGCSSGTGSGSCATAGVTIVLTTHDMDEAAELTDRVGHHGQGHGCSRWTPRPRSTRSLPGGRDPRPDPGARRGRTTPERLTAALAGLARRRAGGARRAGDADAGRGCGCTWPGRAAAQHRPGRRRCSPGAAHGWARRAGRRAKPGGRVPQPDRPGPAVSSAHRCPAFARACSGATSSSPAASCRASWPRSCCSRCSCCSCSARCSATSATPAAASPRCCSRASWPSPRSSPRCRRTALPLVIDFSFTKEIEDRLLAPLPTSPGRGREDRVLHAAGARRRGGDVPARPADPRPARDRLRPTLPLVARVPGPRARWSAPRVGLTLGTLGPRPKINIVFALVLTPLLFTGSTQFPWSSLDRTCAGSRSCARSTR